MKLYSFLVTKIETLEKELELLEQPNEQEQQEGEKKEGPAKQVHDLELLENSKYLELAQQKAKVSLKEKIKKNEQKKKEAKEKEELAK